MAQQDSSGPAPTDVGRLSYEQARDELVDVVRRLESGSAPLEDSLALWERGEALADRCQQVLDGARERLDARIADREPADAQRDEAGQHEAGQDKSAESGAPAESAESAESDAPLDPRIPVRRRPAGENSA